eukprot:jgi/Botrbrau1/2545/Bobra.0079s0032.1
MYAPFPLFLPGSRRLPALPEERFRKWDPVSTITASNPPLPLTPGKPPLLQVPACPVAQTTEHLNCPIFCNHPAFVEPSQNTCAGPGASYPHVFCLRAFSGLSFT